MSAHPENARGISSVNESPSETPRHGTGGGFFSPLHPLLLDLFCGAGGCAVGYARAGFRVVGVDHKPQPRYPFPFIQEDALAILRWLNAGGHIGDGYALTDFGAIHASPPCQRYSAASRCLKTNTHPDLVGAARELLAATGLPWVIENVPGSPLRCAAMLCGTFFGLKVIRHRWFESSEMLLAPSQRCQHPPRGTVGKGGHDRGKQPGDWISVAGSPRRVVAAAAMGIDWMRREELAQAIPPAYTEFIGQQLRRVLQ